MKHSVITRPNIATRHGKPRARLTKRPYANILLILPFLTIVAILSLTPVISRDALIHHMALPKIWLESGIWRVDAYRPYAFYPSNLQFLYYLSLAFQAEFLPKIIHFSFLILTSWLIYHYLIKQEFHPYLASLAFILNVTIPIHQRLASEVYVDLGLLFFSSLSLLYFLKWKNSDFLHTTYFYISAVGSGLAVGTKYNGLIPFIIINLFVFYAYARASKSSLKAVLYGAKFFVVAMICVSPWLVRNYLASGGNPFYPLFTSIFPDNLGMPRAIQDIAGSSLLYRMSSGESLLDILLIPVRFFIQGEDHNFLRFDGKLNPMMLILLPFAFIRDRSKGTTRDSQRSDEYYLLLYALLVLLISLKGAIRIRYAIPVIFPLVILNAYGLKTLFSFQSKVWHVLGCLFIVFYISYNMSYSYELYKRLDLGHYLTFRETREEYLRRNLHLYKMYEFINAHTKKEAVIYDVLCGHRSYYVDREYIHDQHHIDKAFFATTTAPLSSSYYIDYLGGLKTQTGSKVTHLLIKPHMLIETYKNIFARSGILPKDVYQDRLSQFVRFLKQQKPLFETEGAVLYELVYDHTS